MRSLPPEEGGSSGGSERGTNCVFTGDAKVDTRLWREKVVTCVYVCVCVSACKSKWFPMKHDWIRPEKPFENRKCCGRAVGEGLEVFERRR